MNNKLIRDFHKKKIVLFNGKVLPVLGTVDYENNPHLILGERSRSVLGQNVVTKSLANIPFQCVNKSYPKVPKASKKMPTVLSQSEMKVISGVFSCLYKPLEYTVYTDKSINSGFANVQYNFISIPFLQSNNGIEDGGFLEYPVVTPVWRKYGYVTARVVTKNYEDLQEQVVFSMWAFLIHELAHIVHHNRVKCGQTIDRESHGGQYRKALSDLLEEDLYEDFYKKVKENL